MTAPAARIARGTVRRASSISSPIVDPLSTPPKANASVDQKMMSFTCMLGTSACAFIGVAEPNRLHATAPRPISSIAGIHAGDRADVVQPLPHVQADHVHRHRDREAGRGDGDEVRAVGRQRLPRRAAHEERVGGGVVQQAGKVRQVRSPVGPAGHERGERPERALAPDVDAALLRVPRRQLEDGEHERHEEARAPRSPRSTSALGPAAAATATQRRLKPVTT